LIAGLEAFIYVEGNLETLCLGVVGVRGVGVFSFLLCIKRA